MNFLLDESAEFLCFDCGDDSVSPFPQQGMLGCCAVVLWGDLGPVDGGNDGFAGCKAHGCGLLVKPRFYVRPSLCYRDVVVCCRSSGLEVPSYRSHGLQLAVERFLVVLLRSCGQIDGEDLPCH